MEESRPKAFWAKKLKMSLERQEGQPSVSGEQLLSPDQAGGACMALNSATATQPPSSTGLRA